MTVISSVQKFGSKVLENIEGLHFKMLMNITGGGVRGNHHVLMNIK